LLAPSEPGAVELEQPAPAIASEGRQNLLCVYLAAALLVGLLGNALFGAWWLDPLVGLLIAAVALQEGREAWRGDACTH
jgi:divalent metal cation (Fe/Co/Zn/Cd) transporter